MTKSDRCPSCCNAVDSASDKCSECQFPLAMLRAIDKKPVCQETLSSLDHCSERPPITRVSRSSARVDPETTILIGSQPDSPRSGVQRIFEPHQLVAPDHVAIFCDIDGKVWAVWIADNGLPLYVDGSPMIAAKLGGGSILQLGSFGWEYRLAEQTLQPVKPIRGPRVYIDSQVKGRLLRTELVVRANEMVAIVGPSGCGKSTLIGEIFSGDGLADEYNLDNEVYYMPQTDLVHKDLKIEDELRFVAEFYGQKEVLPSNIEQALRSVELAPSIGQHFPVKGKRGQKGVSGGELKRCRIAAALLSGRGVIILDEPDSGLDHETATEVIRLLRALSLRGATIIAITHHRHVLELFDRVIEMESSENGSRPQGGFIVSDSNPFVDRSEETSPNVETGSDTAATLPIVARPHLSPFHQVPKLLIRELKEYISPSLLTMSIGRITLRIPSVLIPLVLVPLLFAIAISISVPSDPKYAPDSYGYGEIKYIIQFGFLAIVSVVWMSASQSHLAMARQRELYDHERSLGVGWACLLTGKGVVYSGAALVQTSVFLLLLYLLRFLWLGRSFFVMEHRSQLSEVWMCLCVVAIAATALGLLVSTIANRSPLMAAAVLPVLMMSQILFSAQFTISDPHITGAAYPEHMDDYRQLSLWDHDAPSDDDEMPIPAATDKLPLKMTSLMSYLTLTRYGDQWMRSFSASLDPVKYAGYWRLGGITGLLIWATTYYVLAFFWLKLRDQWQAIRDWVNRRRPYTRAPPTQSGTLVILLLAAVGLSLSGVATTANVTAQTSSL